MLLFASVCLDSLVSVCPDVGALISIYSKASFGYVHIFKPKVFEA